MVAATRSARSLQRRMAAMVYGSGDAAANVVPRGPDRFPDRPAPTRPGERGVVPQVVRGPRDRPPGALPGGADARRRDRALLRGAGRGTGRAGDGDPRARRGPAGRDVRVQPARRRQRLGAVPHHDRREGCVGPGLRHGGDPADARPCVRDARAPSHRAVRVRVQRAGDPDLQALRVRRRRAVARVDLPGRAVVGRDRDERARVRLAPAARRGRRGERGARPARGGGAWRPRGATPRARGATRTALPRARRPPGCCGARCASCDDERAARRRMRRGPTSAS